MLPNVLFPSLIRHVAKPPPNPSKYRRFSSANYQSNHHQNELSSSILQDDPHQVKLASQPSYSSSTYTFAPPPSPPLLQHPMNESELHYKTKSYLWMELQSAADAKMSPSTSLSIRRICSTRQNREATSVAPWWDCTLTQTIHDWITDWDQVEMEYLIPGVGKLDLALLGSTDVVPTSTIPTTCHSSLVGRSSNGRDEGKGKKAEVPILLGGIEVYHTSFMSVAKIAELKRRQIPWIEIHANNNIYLTKDNGKLDKDGQIMDFLTWKTKHDQDDQIDQHSILQESSKLISLKRSSPSFTPSSSLTFSSLSFFGSQSSYLLGRRQDDRWHRGLALLASQTSDGPYICPICQLGHDNIELESLAAIVDIYSSNPSLYGFGKIIRKVYGIYRKLISSDAPKNPHRTHDRFLVEATQIIVQNGRMPLVRWSRTSMLNGSPAEPRALLISTTHERRMALPDSDFNYLENHFNYLIESMRQEDPQAIFDLQLPWAIGGESLDEFFSKRDKWARLVGVTQVNHLQGLFPSLTRILKHSYHYNREKKRWKRAPR